MSDIEKNIITEEDVEEMISIRLKPHIYAFSTNTIPKYIKVGDTFRPIETRLNEWRKDFKELQRKFPDITKEFESEACFLNDGKEIYFRDYSVHNYLISKGFTRLEPEEFKKYGYEEYLSNEFFKEMPVSEIKNAIQTIKDLYKDDNSPYRYYNLNDRKEDEFHWNNTEKWTLRDNQKKVVDKFEEKVKYSIKAKNIQIELLMYAVMRFGKSFTSMCCAERMGYSKVLIVSAKADVKNEWKKTVEKPEVFKSYRFICDDDLKKSNSIIEDTLNGKSEGFTDKDRVAVFLTLQNISGKSSDGEDIKERLKQVFTTKFDLIIVDETHYGAWANTYGKALKSTKTDNEDIGSIIENINEQEEIINQIKNLNSKVKLHLSGTPYNLLYDNKFTEENMIATCQFSDILEEKEKWDKEHLNIINEETNKEYEEYENPYFGFPKMLRFAFNLPKATQKKLASLSKDGSWKLNELFKTKGSSKKTEFVHYNEVLNLLKVIDGKDKDDSILSFLEIPRIKNNRVCKHMVMVLPLKSSCDAMEILLEKEKDNFINLKNYEIINITGHNLKPENNTIEKVKNRISGCEKEGKRTICLTVNKMLTGVTVPEWDTMIMLKNTKSAQEYDQAVFRIQNQFVEEIPYNKENTNDKTENNKNTKDEPKYIKIDKKPQTILVDFDPIRMFEIQGLSSRIVNEIQKDNKERLDEKIETELNYFPIITYNADKLVKVTPRNIVEIISNYNKDKSIIEEASDIEFDTALLDDDYIREYISQQYEKGIKNSLKDTMHTGEEESEVEIENGGEGEKKEKEERKNNNSAKEIKNNEIETFRKKYVSCVALLLFYAFLTKSKIHSLRELKNSYEIENDYKKENEELVENLGIDRKFIELHLEKCNQAFADNINSKIACLNLLSHDETISDEERLNRAIKKFSRISESEIITPLWLCKDMLKVLDENNRLVEIVTNGGRILDIASKTGEFIYSLYSILKDKTDKDKINKCLFAIPTSSVSYELTKKIFEIVKLPTENIAKFTSYDLLKVKKIDANGKDTDELDIDKISNLIRQNKSFNRIKIDDILIEGEDKVKFDIIVGNPPYQETIKEATKGNNKITASLYQSFQDIALHLSNMTCMIYPAQEYQHGDKNTLDKNLVRLRIYNGSNRSGEKHIPDEGSVFEDSVRRIPGDVGVFLYDKNNPTDRIIYQDIEIDRSEKILPVMKELLAISKKLEKCANSFSKSDIRKVCESYFVERNPDKVKECIDRNLPAPKGYTKVITNDKEGSGGNAKWYYIKTECLDRTPINNKYKVVIGSARPNESFSSIKNIEILNKDESFGRTKLCIFDTDSKDKAQVCKNYFSSKFAQCVNMITPIRFLYYLPNFDDVYEDIKLKSLKKLDKEANEKYNCETINEVDAKLYQKYNFEKEEIQFIEKIIKTN